MEVVGGRELGFFPGICRGGAFGGFRYHSEDGARAAEVEVVKGAFDTGEGGLGEELPDGFRCYYNGGGVFVDADKFGETTSKVQVLARYTEEIAVEGGETKAAMVYCKVGEGAAILTGPHPE